MNIPFRALLLGSLFCVAFGYICIISLNQFGVDLPATQISSFAFVLIILLVVCVNPLMRQLRMKVFSKQEICIVAIMAIVPAGLPVYGFVSQFLPMVIHMNNPVASNANEEFIKPNLQQKMYVDFDDEDEWNKVNKGVRIRGEEAYPVFLPKGENIQSYPGDVKAYFTGNPEKRKFWGDIPWANWVGPIASWVVFIFIALTLFITLNQLLFKQWYQNEKLVFPHTELLSNVIGLNDEEGRIPAIYKTMPFWFGFSIAFTIMFYNGVANAGWVSGLTPIAIKGGAVDLSPYIQNSVLHGITPIFRLGIFFTVIGLAFLLPAEISFSIWFFYLFMKFQQWSAVQMGFGESGSSFGKNWLTNTNFMTAQGGGAMMVFGLACLWKVRHNLLAFIYRLAKPNGTGQYTADDIKENSRASFAFWCASAALIGFLHWANISVGMAVLIYVVVVLMVITMVRMVSEGGILAFQVWFGPFHLLKSLGLMKFTGLFSASSLPNALTIFSSAFLDVKTMIAPTLMTGRALAEKAGLKNSRFLFSAYLGFGLILAIAIITSLTLIYDKGVNNMSMWFYTWFPKGMVRTTNAAMNNPEAFAAIQWDQTAWTGVGAATMGGMLWVRRIFFWFPHPIGLLMFISPMIQAQWFSFFIAWVCKSFTVKYAKPDTYKVMKYFFTGLILGELVIVVLSVILSIAGAGNMNINLNRN